MTWQQLLTTIGAAIRAFIQAHPELAGGKINPGATLHFGVDGGTLGQITVTIEIPRPLAASTGKVHVSLQDAQSTDVDLPA